MKNNPIEQSTSKMVVLTMLLSAFAPSCHTSKQNPMVEREFADRQIVANDE
jgi:hypothetical protein